jgi:ATP-dependent RNA helicase RhlE
MICVPQDEKNLDAIEKLVQQEIPKVENPVKPAKADTQDSEKKTSRRRGKGEPEAAEDTIAVEAQESKQDRKDRRRGGGRRKSDHDDPKVVGMGDHMPSFIAMSFEERRAS